MLQESSVGPSLNCFQRVAAWFFGLFQSFLVFLYQKLVDEAPPGSRRVRMFAALAQGERRVWQNSFIPASAFMSIHNSWLY